MELTALNKSTGIITVDGILSAESEEGLNSTIKDARQREILDVILDFRPLDHMNSAGASVLVKLAALAKRQKQRLFAYGLSGRYREIFNLTGLGEGITLFNDTSSKPVVLSEAEATQLAEMSGQAGRQDDSGWTPNFTRFRITDTPEGAMNKNMNGRRVLGPLQGYGPMWQKTYLITIEKAGTKPEDVITVMKEHFPEFQPPQNKFYATSKGITAGEPVFIDSATPGGIVSTGVLVLYADDISFTLMTPQGHPEAGWVTFSASNQEDAIEMQIQGLARASDPLYELAFRVAGSKFQETIWKHVLASLGSYLVIEANVRMEKTCVVDDLRWSKTGNIWYNAQIRSLPYNIPRLFGK